MIILPKGFTHGFNPYFKYHFLILFLHPVANRWSFGFYPPTLQHLKKSKTQNDLESLKYRILELKCIPIRP